jgi:acyl transferase domain-containing protein/thioesterase domain-containing protein/acyl carrier protein
MMPKKDAIAIVGMSCRFPDARNVGEFWRNLRDGKEAIRSFSDAELLAAGVSSEEFKQREYVKAGVVLEDLDKFDAAFFGFSPKDAAIMDPQHRVFLECAWEALENSGHAPESFAGSIGVYAGSGMNSYMIHNLLSNQELVESAGLFLIRQTGNDKDVLATRVSYEFDLHGPSINVQTACSTSLVAVHLACQSLLNQECDMALAGGVTIEFPHGRGYQYRDGEILSRDGHCRAFDANSSGTVFSSGAGLVVLRRLEDAEADRDTIHAIILGSAINNDGSRKIGYLAPSVDGQAEVIAEALAIAEVKSDAISYVETHGTGTRVGDPIEIKALTQAFRQSGRATSCAIGSVKTNIGHLDTAAGIAGLIKTTLALKHRQIPPGLHFQSPNPLIDFEHSPFYVNTALAEWKRTNAARRAGVTSLGIGGTNAHVVLEETPSAVERAPRKNPHQLLVLSARTASALDQASLNLASYLQGNADLRLEDVAHTLQQGRKTFPHRRVLAVANIEEAHRLLNKPENTRVFTGQVSATSPAPVFMFSGQGSQYVDMGRGLYETDALFRAHVDIGAEFLKTDLDCDLRKVLYPSATETSAATQMLSHTRFTQPALFVIEYALARWWMAHGVVPTAMVGHSIGEYVAACLADVFSFEDGIHLTALRGRLMGEMPGGSMLAVPAASTSLSIPESLSIAAINGAEQCVISGPTEAIEHFADELKQRNISSRMLHTSHAFHSPMMDPMLDAFHDHLAKVKLHSPKIPYLSNVTGTWVTASEAVDPGYWTGHLRNTVRFSDCMAELFRDPARLYLEVGPGRALTSLTRQHPGRPKLSKVIASMRHAQEQESDSVFLLNVAGQAWIQGQSLNWSAFQSGDTPHRIPLPTYPFERKRHWIEPPRRESAGKTTARAADARSVTTESMFHERVWKKAPIESVPLAEPAAWLVFLDELGVGVEITKQLTAAGHHVVQVAAGSRYKRSAPGRYAIRPGIREDYDRLLTDITRYEQSTARVLHLWPLTGSTSHRSLNDSLDRTFYSLLFLAQALGAQDVASTQIVCVSNGLHSVAGEAVIEPARAALLGPIRVIPKELPSIACRHFDLDRDIGDVSRAANAVISDCTAPSRATCVAYRGGDRWVEGFESLALRMHPSTTRLKERGVYLITGGLGGIGLAVAEYLARTVHARLVLVGRTPVPPPSAWGSLTEASEGADVTLQKTRKLRELQTAGAELLTIAADITDRKQCENAVRTAKQRFGTIDGVFHAAGVIEDAPLQIKMRDNAARVLAPKIQGTLALQDALRDYKLDFWVLFSSVSSLTPPSGQVDYAGANAFLDAFANSRAGQPVTAVNWGMWSGVGMAEKNLGGIYPILNRRIIQSEAETIDAIELSKEHWLIAEHKFKDGPALVPGTAYLQLAAASFINQRFEPGVAFEDVFFLAPLLVKSDGPREVRIRLHRQASGSHFSILARDGEWIEYASGHVSRNQGKVPADQDVDKVRARCTRRRINFDELQRTQQERYFTFGPRWRSLRTVHIGQREALAELRLENDFAQDLPTWFLHPALLDLATGVALYLIEGYGASDFMYLPLSYKQIAIYRLMPKRVYSHIRCRQDNTARREIATFDITLLDSDGKVVAEIQEFCMRRMATTLNSAAPIPRRAVVRSDSERAAIEVKPGISVSDGIKALEQVLASDMPPGIIIVPGGITATDTALSNPDFGASGSANVATEIEAVLIAWWQDLLGVESVGLDDDFFDLGGHSLTAVRLFSKIKKIYEKDFALSTLFEARTVRQLADLIREARTSGSSEATSTSAVVPIRREGHRLPLFVVSGVGGQVIAFNAAARHLGEDQPVFALQPQGLDGRSPFLTTVEDMAAYYVRAIREVRPHGPYNLAGYSFGGFVVFEMAQQLVAAGEKVSMLALLDTIEWQYLERYQRDADLRRRLAMYKIRLHRIFSSRYGLRQTGNRVASVFKRKFHYLTRKMGVLSAPGRPDINTVNRIAASLYRPAIYPGRLTIFRSISRSLLDGDDEMLGWGGRALGGIEIHDVIGTHLDMLDEPNVRILAEQLRACLDGVQEVQDQPALP